MDNIQKYRIVGAAVLLSLAVIFVPMILDGSGRHEITTVDMEIPPEPEYVFVEDSEPVANSSASEDSAVRDSNVEIESVPPAKDISVPESTAPEIVVSKDADPAELAWVVQVGAFAEMEKAAALKDKLLEAKFDAFVEVGKSGDKSIYRVKVGPMVKRESAERIQAKLKEQQGIDQSLVMKHPQAREKS